MRWPIRKPLLPRFLWTGVSVAVLGVGAMMVSVGSIRPGLVLALAGFGLSLYQFRCLDKELLARLEEDDDGS